MSDYSANEKFAQAAVARRGLSSSANAPFIVRPLIGWLARVRSRRLSQYCIGEGERATPGRAGPGRAAG